MIYISVGTRERYVLLPKVDFSVPLLFVHCIRGCGSVEAISVVRGLSDGIRECIHLTQRQRSRRRNHFVHCSIHSRNRDFARSLHVAHTYTELDQAVSRLSGTHAIPTMSRNEYYVIRRRAARTSKIQSMGSCGSKSMVVGIMHKGIVPPPL